MTIKFKINKDDHNFYGFDLERIAKMFEGKLTYVNTFCVKNNYLPVAVFFNSAPSRSKNHKDYLLVWEQSNYFGEKELMISGMDKEEMNKYKYQHGMYCPDCNEVIYSVYRHDYRSCSCGRCTVDGGKDYFKTNLGGHIVKINLLTDEILLIKH